ncbi:protein maelstrom homolog [Contarinia nasturtii]|uniref:protein maelstrom homolog n=1 Tax=Contarinia nasturtii TaxID=265458 RepID=UPI0012D43F08|nr:protein maelstrom homolog [Contarinia nasturtii]
MPKAGPYYLYMLDFKRDQEQRCGRQLTLPEVSQMASTSWNAMSEDEKAYYKQKAKGGDMKIPRRNNNNTKTSDSSSLLTSHGVPVIVYEQVEREKQMELENMRRRIGSMVQRMDLMTDFTTYPFYFMYGNYFYKHSEGHYSPAEIGLIKFTFRDGVLKRHCAFINPEHVEIGYAYTAKAHSEETHQIPPPPNDFGETNYQRVMFNIKKFMKEDGVQTFDGGNQMIFTYHDPYTNEENQVDVLKDFLKQFADEREQHNIDVYPLTRLFYVLRKELAARGKTEAIPNENFTNILLSRDPYESIGGISCGFHEEKDATRHCALSRCRRWAFQLADHFCQPLEIKLVRGQHLPNNADISSSALSLESDVSVNVDESKIDHSTSEMDKASTVASEHRAGSLSTLNFDDQSVQTASSGTTRVKRQSRRSVALKMGSQSNITSSTFYNRP